MRLAYRGALLGALVAWTLIARRPSAERNQPAAESELARVQPPVETDAHPASSPVSTIHV